MIMPIVWKSYNADTPASGYWDQTMLEDVFSRELWKPIKAYTFDHYILKHGDSIQDVAEIRDHTEGCVLIIPARHSVPYADEINLEIARLKWVLVILVGDEEASFPCEKLQHPNMKIWVMTPHQKKHTNADRWLVNGYAPKTRHYLKQYKLEALRRKLNWFFAGQVTHDRRQKAVEIMRKMTNGILIETPGFLQGIPHDKYFQKMSSAKVVPCPSGAVIPDTFRMYEALEAGCLPIADGKAPHLDTKGYWNFLFGEDELPFPVITRWRTLPGTVQYHVDTYPIAANRVFAWWQKYKRSLVYNLEDDIKFLSKQEVESNRVDDNVTILIPTSPIKEHPDTRILEETIKTVRERFKTAEIIIMFDGVRPEQADRMQSYQEYIRRVLLKCNLEWSNVLPLIFDTHHHQVAMTREALKLVKTACIMFVEHDAPLCEEVPSEAAIALIMGGEANMVRMNHEALILPEHRSFLLDKEPQEKYGVKFSRTAQWSQRPHFASTEFYRKMLDECFTPDAICMIEDGVHGKVSEAFRTRGQVGWNDWKVWIYTPDGDQKRSYHIDGRQGDSKFDDRFIY